MQIVPMTKFEDFDLETLFARLVASRHNGPKRVAKYTRPDYAYFSIAVLCPPDFEWTTGSMEHAWEWYEHYDDRAVREFCLEPLIMHGHPRTERCTNDKFCHVHGYRPRGDEKPSFIEGFYRKWPQYRPESPSIGGNFTGLGDSISLD